MTEQAPKQVGRLRASAVTLPVDVLDVIFSFAIDIPYEVDPHGGYLMSWYSNETTAQLALVCKDWHEAAISVLYRSVSISNRPSTDAFLRTLNHCPVLANKVNFLVLSLAQEGLQSASSAVSLLEDSLTLLEAVKLCANTVAHLHIHPLHSEARPALFKVLAAATNLESLVCSPRFFDPETAVVDAHGPFFNHGGPVPANQGGSLSSSWAVDFYSRTDLYDLAFPPSLRVLELDFESSWSARHLPIHNGLSLEALRKLRLRTTAALRASAGTMHHMLFLCNPTFRDLAFFDATAEPIFDRLLPSFTSLETISVSATEISTSVFRLVPPSLLALEVQAFNHVSTFVYAPQLVEDLRNPRYAPGLKSLVIHDAAEAWEAEHIEELARACEEREVEFTFFPDSEAGSR
ncbi:hypothetical protein JCM11641_004042 [Rhodosporidiobolus odoratus]